MNTFPIFALAFLMVWDVLLTVAVIWLFIELKAMQKSTHQVTYINPFAGHSGTTGEDSGFEEASEETKEKIRKAADPFGDVIL